MVRLLAKVKAAGLRCFALSNMETQPFVMRLARFRS
jgi:hypothetical protein